MNRSRFAVWLVSGIMVLGLAVTAIAAGEGKDAEQTKTGTVKKVDVDGKTLTVMVSRELTFAVTDKTKITEGGKPKKLADIKVDAKVSVDYVKDGDTRTARKITIQPDK
jgi:hypothetical protein